MTDPSARPEPPLAGGETEQLSGFLDFLRATIVWKAAGLTDEQARRSLLPSPLTTVAGLLAHLTYVEHHWFGTVLLGQPDPWPALFAADPDAEFRAADGKSLATLLEGYQRECAASRDAVADLLPEQEFPYRDGQRITVRWVLAHMVEETARHAGHLDVLRELIDGLTGE